jgi:TetR/AcrR family transcriptional regulator, transcriptional repressor for nem operon
MPRKSRAETAATHERILHSAGRLMRERGFDGVGIDDIVTAAGVTAGAFYTHFESKLALFDEVVQLALAQTEMHMPQIESEQDIERFVNAYLSDRSVRNIGVGCIVAAMSADLARQSDASRMMAARYIQLIQSRISQALGARLGEHAASESWRIVSQLIGALIISRIMQKPSVTKRLRSSAMPQVR